MTAGLLHDHEAEHSTGGALCLEFTNTTSARRTDAPSEHLHSYADLLAWAQGQEILAPELAARLASEGERRAQAAADALQRALELREALYRIFTAHADGLPPAAADLQLLNTALAEAMPHRRLAAGTEGFSWQWEAEADTLAQMLWPVARSAADLLTSPDLARVRECAGATCDWLFIDRSKNHSRRWCDMQECGNVAKVRRYRTRKQASA